MEFDVCVHAIERKALTAKPVDSHWSPQERAWPFEVVPTSDIEPQAEEFEIILDCSFGALAVPASEVAQWLISS